MRLKLLSLLFCLSIFFISYSQEIPYHISNVTVYEFIDELANLKIIEINSCIKPYSRKFIADKLLEAQGKSNQLNKRQKKELDFYLKDFGKELNGMQTMDFYFKKYLSEKDTHISKRPDLFYYKDSLFTVTINPILGGNYFIKKSQSIYQRWNGAEVFATIGKHWGIYANLRDDYESEPLEKNTYFTQRTGVRYKSTNSGDYDYGAYSEMRGGITYSWNWGSFGIMKDHFEWGDNYNGANIFSGRTPSFAFIKLSLKPVKWFEFNYIHGWLFSDVIDSSRSYHYGNQNRNVFVGKWLTANMLTIIPFEKLNISLGNSIIYSDVNQTSYLIPVLFYKSVDHSLNTNNQNGQNSQMFFNISSRNIKYLHLYFSCFIDELSLKRAFVKDKESSFLSNKVGFNLSNFPLQNINLIAEFTRTNPLTYQHFIPTTTFASYSVNMGSYLRDNSQEIYFALGYKPISKLHLNVSYTYAKHGENFIYGYDTININGPKIHYAIGGVPFMRNVTWESKIISFKVQYELFHDAYFFIELIRNETPDLGYTMNYLDPQTGALAIDSKTKKPAVMKVIDYYTPPFFQGKNNIISCGLNLGF